ncbi:endonuclease domain-containing protein [Actinomadura kijaniata]|uniref:endonuclease domain-containing protein n=1 Tax=Actinomadura kijaniata TaxID=46161 RepID=UPI000A077054
MENDHEPVQYVQWRLAKLGRPKERCLVCRTNRIPHVRDHCHKHGWIRGVLCNTCNGTMRWLDRGALLRAAGARAEVQRYIEHWLRCPDCAVRGWRETAYCKCDRAEPRRLRRECNEPAADQPCPWEGVGFRPPLPPTHRSGRRKRADDLA